MTTTPGTDRVLLTRTAAAAYLGVDRNSLSAGRVAGQPEPVLTVGRTGFYDADQIIELSSRGAPRAGHEVDERTRALIIAAAPTIPSGTTVVGYMEITRLHTKPDGSPLGNADVARWADKGTMIEPVARFDTPANQAAGTVERTPPLYDLDAYLKHAKTHPPVRVTAVDRTRIDHAVVDELRRTHTLG